MNRKSGVPQFNPDNDLDDLDDGDWPWWFEAAMVSTCRPLLDTCDDNYQVEALLTISGVIDETCQADSETSALVVTFRTQADGLAFIDRLNRYLRQLAGKGD